MKRLPDPARWERVCRANDASAAKAVLRDAGWGSGRAGTLHPLVQEGVDRCWSEACLAGSDRVLACQPGGLSDEDEALGLQDRRPIRSENIPDGQ